MRSQSQTAYIWFLQTYCFLDRKGQLVNLHLIVHDEGRYAETSVSPCLSLSPFSLKYRARSSECCEFTFWKQGVSLCSSRSSWAKESHASLQRDKGQTDSLCNSSQDPALPKQDPFPSISCTFAQKTILENTWEAQPVFWFTMFDGISTKAVENCQNYLTYRLRCWNTTDICKAFFGVICHVNLLWNSKERDYAIKKLFDVDPEFNDLYIQLHSYILQAPQTQRGTVLCWNTSNKQTKPSSQKTFVSNWSEGWANETDFQKTKQNKTCDKPLKIRKPQQALHLSDTPHAFSIAGLSWGVYMYFRLASVHKRSSKMFKSIQTNTSGKLVNGFFQTPASPKYVKSTWIYKGTWWPVALALIEIQAFGMLLPTASQSAPRHPHWA